MCNDPGHTDDLEAYPRQGEEGRPEPRRRSRVLLALAVAGAVVAGSLVAGAGVVVLLIGLDPMGDEWVCSKGEAPAAYAEGGSDCFREGSTLPPGATWEPFGNRPMSYNCDKDGWVLIERTVQWRGVFDDEQDCVREGTVLPGRWHLAPEK